jgi:DNA-binding transcriptional regulator GbsR (MarR family)
MSNQTISSDKLEKILEVNAKAIEINTIVNAQFESIMEHLKTHAVGDDELREEIESVVKLLEEQSKSTKQTYELLQKVERVIFKLNIILLSSSTAAILTILAKLILKI